MASNCVALVPCLLLCISISLAQAPPNSINESFIQCLTLHTPPTTNISHLLFSPDSTLYSSLLLTYIQNLRFTSPSSPKPLLIITPTEESHVQASVICSKALNIPVRIRSGGHDYEGLSYRSVKHSPFVMVDLSNLRSITVDTESAVAWVQAGATIGELTYKIAEKSSTLGFPVGDCHSVGVGGFISGGGFGSLARKYGLAADHVLDAKLVDANGRLLEGELISKNLLWAIKGGGGSSFGIIVSWKLKLVPVPPIVTVCTVNKRSVQLVDRWQHVAHELNDNLFIRLTIQPPLAVFTTMYIGEYSELQPQMATSFPELGLERGDCREMSWAESVMYVAGYTNGEPIEVLKDRSRGAQPKAYTKTKSDYVEDIIPEGALHMLWESVLGAGSALVYLYPQGGRMDEIEGSATPYPHRRGSRYLVQYIVKWDEGGEEELAWIRGLYRDMAAYVSKKPRGAYLNFRDLDLGRNVEGEEGNYSKSKMWGRKYFKANFARLYRDMAAYVSKKPRGAYLNFRDLDLGRNVEEIEGNYSKAKVWGMRYFKGNFARLAMVKCEVDPENFFRFEQSIPPACKEYCHQQVV